jgi:hypothetical protein
LAGRARVVRRGLSAGARSHSDWHRCSRRAWCPPGSPGEVGASRDAR